MDENVAGGKIQVKLLQITSAPMLQHEKTMVFRFRRETPANLPLAVRACGTHFLVPHCPPPPTYQKWFSEVYWTEKGCGEFELGNTKVRVRENEIFYYLPGEFHTLRPISDPWHYHWFTLDQELSPRWLEAFGFVTRPFQASRCPSELFRKLQDALREATNEGDRRASEIAYSILLAASERIPDHSDVRHNLSLQCKRLMDERFADSRLNIKTISAELRVHRATLLRLFRNTYGTTPSQYLQSRRLHHAIDLLKNGELQVQEIAAQVGMTDSNYLTRMIRKVSGMSPKKLRANYSAG